ncbi:MAG: V-type ATP synthase subunit E [Oscillospiraceae bacterium]
MDNNTARLELFRQAINTQADAEAAEIARQAEERSAALAKERSERSTNEALAGIKAERSRVAAYYKKELSRCDFDMKKAVLTHRNELIGQLFGDIRQQLSNFVNSPAYAEYLTKAIDMAVSEIGSSGAVIYARAADISAVKQLTSLAVVEDNSIMLGGICAGNPSAGLFSDYTLDSRLAQQQEQFSGKSELRL